MIQQRNCSPTARKSTYARSAVSNGTRLLEGVAKHSSGGRRYRDIVEDLIAELGGEPTTAEQLTVRMIAGLVVHAERLTADSLNGLAVDAEQFTRVANAAARLLSALKAKRRARARAGGVADYLRDRPA